MSSTAEAALTGILPYIDDWLRYRVWKTRVPGAQVAIWFGGDIRFSAAYGVADVETRAPLTTEHLFRVASHSKTFTATAILQLFERGLLRLDDEAGTFIPELVGPVAHVTVRELLGHGAGIVRDGFDGDFWQLARPFPDQEELMRMLASSATKVDRGSSFNYTNVGYSLLGLIVAAVSGTTYNDYVSGEIVDRLGLANTGPEFDPARADAYAAGHTGLHTDLTRTRIEHVDTRAMAAATGFYSTADDLVTYFAAHFFGDERLLIDASKYLQQREEWSSDASDPGARHYGLGMIIDRVDGHRVVGHSGGYPGHITRSLFDPLQGIAISVLTNAIDGPAAELSDGVLRLLDASLALPASIPFGVRDQEADVVDQTDASRFTGRFANLWGVVDVVKLGHRLVMIHPGGANPLDGMDDLVVTGDDTLRITKGSGFGSVGETVRYEFAADGSVLSVRGGSGMSLWPVDPQTGLAPGANR